MTSPAVKVPGCSYKLNLRVMRDEIDGIDHYPRINVRMPAYHRLDLGVTFTRLIRTGIPEFGISVSTTPIAV